MHLHRPSGACAAAVLAGMLALGPSGPAQSAEPVGSSTQLETVAAVRLIGRHSVPASALRAVMKTRPPRLWPWSEKPLLRLDFVRSDVDAIRTVYRQAGYLDVQVESRITTTRRPGRVLVSFQIEEGRRSHIGRVSIEGNTAYRDAALEKKLYARPGRPFNPVFVVADTALISRLYQDRGFIPHVESEVERDSLTVNVTYRLHEGPLYHFGDVYLSSPGELHTAERLIRRELVIRRGEVYRIRRIEDSQQRLYDTGLFSQVQVTPLVDSTNSNIDVDLRVRERKPRWLDGGIGSGTAERFRFTGEWGHRNLGGQGLQGVLSSRLAFDGNAKFLLSHTEASLLEPWLLRTRTRGLVTVYYERRDDRADPRWVVAQDAKGLTFQVRRDFGRASNVTLTQDNTFVTQSIEFLDATVADSTRDSLTLNVPSQYTTHRLQLAGLRDRRDDPLDPHAGSAQTLTLEIAGGPLKGTSSFEKWEFASAWYTPMPNGWVIALRARGGTIRPFGHAPPFSPSEGIDPNVASVPLEDRFRLGGVNSIRGFSENAISLTGGLAMALANAELRVPLVGPFGLEFYLDAGNVWNHPAELTWNDLRVVTGDRPLTATEVRYVFGAGARLNLPFGPLRVDFTWSPRPDENGNWLVAKPQFAIGPAF